MAPVATENSHRPVLAAKAIPSHEQKHQTGAGNTEHRVPLVLTGILDAYPYSEITPNIGREYTTLKIRDLLHADDADELLRELAIIISRRGVVALRGQEGLTPEEQKEFTSKLSKLTGSPADSGLHIHPIMNAQRDKSYLAADKNGTVTYDDTISIIHSKFRREAYKDMNRSGAFEWHSDITFEKIPADYTSLLIHTTPETGGDTLFSSGYEIYDRLSPTLRGFVDQLQARFAQPGFNRIADEQGSTIHKGPRGSPHNVGEVLEAFHPFIRTNPVTGWKSVFGLGQHFDSLVGLTDRESQLLKDHILHLVTTEHSAQVRIKWSQNSDLVVWDNRSVYHAATPDYAADTERVGARVVALGEKPYFDPQSISRREELGSRTI